MDDFLALGTRDFSSSRAIIFVGASGSGKSTALAFLQNSHPQVRHLDWRIIRNSPINWKEADTTANALILDEIHSALDTLKVYWLLLGGKRLLVASHAPAWLLLPLKLLGVCQVFRTDTDKSKIARCLERKQVTFTDEAVTYYCKRYRATYTDLEIILERCPATHFDTALSRFERYNDLDIERLGGFGTSLLRLKSTLNGFRGLTATE